MRGNTMSHTTGAQEGRWGPVSFEVRYHQTCRRCRPLITKSSHIIRSRLRRLDHSWALPPKAPHLRENNRNPNATNIVLILSIF